MHELNKNGSLNKADFKRQKGSVGIDLVINYDSKPILGIDLKTGRGSSSKRNSKLSRRLGGADIVEVQFDWR